MKYCQKPAQILLKNWAGLLLNLLSYGGNMCHGNLFKEGRFILWKKH
jgi:hypothetical protein